MRLWTAGVSFSEMSFRDPKCRFTISTYSRGIALGQLIWDCKKCKTNCTDLSHQCLETFAVWRNVALHTPNVCEWIITAPLQDARTRRSLARQSFTTEITVGLVALLRIVFRAQAMSENSKPFFRNPSRRWEEDTRMSLAPFTMVRVVLPRVHTVAILL